MDWSNKGVPGVWELGDVKKIVPTPRHIVIHRKDSNPLYLSREVALAAYGEALKGADERQRAAIIRDRKIDYAILASMAALWALAVVLAWLR